MIVKCNNSKESLSEDNYYDKLAEEYLKQPSDIDYSLAEDCLKYENNPFKEYLI